MSTSKERIDVLLVEQAYFESREKAKASIMAGLVFADGERIEKPGMKIPRAAEITVKGAPHPYVGRGGLKLEKAIRTFELEMDGITMMDIGSSTGGFTDCALQHGASLVYAIDVGYNQLDWSLRNDERVKVMERTNFRYVEREHLDGPTPNMATIDVSFISLKLILPPLKAIIAKPGTVIALIKPQFEAGRDKVGKTGVVKDPNTHISVLRDILDFAADMGFELKGLTYSPITGGEGNIEFLAYWQVVPLEGQSSEPQAAYVSRDRIDDVVTEANRTFRSVSS